jgi:hypothetical protein
LIDIVQGIVDDINAILRTIITSFNLTFGGVNWGSQGTSGTSNLGQVANSSGSPDDRDNKSATVASSVAQSNPTKPTVARLSQDDIYALRMAIREAVVMAAG